MKIDYKHKNWDKKLKERKKIVKDLKGEMVGETNINTFYTNFVENKEHDKETCKRYLGLCLYFSGD